MLESRKSGKEKVKGIHRKRRSDIGIHPSTFITYWNVRESENVAAND